MKRAALLALIGTAVLLLAVGGWVVAWLTLPARRPRPA